MDDKNLSFRLRWLATFLKREELVWERWADADNRFELLSEDLSVNFETPLSLGNAIMLALVGTWQGPGWYRYNGEWAEYWGFGFRPVGFVDYDYMRYFTNRRAYARWLHELPF
jgi:hypothetical protein